MHNLEKVKNPKRAPFRWSYHKYQNSTYCFSVLHRVQSKHNIYIILIFGNITDAFLFHYFFIIIIIYTQKFKHFNNHECRYRLRRDLSLKKAVCMICLFGLSKLSFSCFHIYLFFIYLFYLLASPHFFCLRLVCCCC